MISKRHSNRGPHNWLIYDIGDRFLERFAPYYRGVMYDLGCGEAPFREYFLNFADRYIGVDWEGSYHATDADIVADLNKPLPIESEVADTVVSLSVLEHLREPQMMLNEAYRILKPGGRIILQVPFMWQVHEAPYDFYRYTCHGLEYLFGKAGFVDISVEATTGFWAMWVLKANYFSTRAIGALRLRPLQWAAQTCLLPFWWLGQKMAQFLDRVYHAGSETAGYFVVARKA